MVFPTIWFPIAIPFLSVNFGVSSSRFVVLSLVWATSYHPQGDGQTEVLNRVPEQYLQSFVHTHQARWSRFLSLTEWSYNTSVHTATGLSPFHFIFGKPPPSIPHYLLGSSPIEAVDQLLTECQELLIVLKRKLEKAKHQMKVQADCKCRDVSYAVHELVYVRLCPYRQLSATGGPYHKLSIWFYGPFQILEKIGSVAYKLALPNTSKILPVFYCSLLKPHIGPLPNSFNQLPASSHYNHPLVLPLTILKSKWDHSTIPPTRHVLVQWLGLPDDSSWENWEEMCSVSHLEDNITCEEGNSDVANNKLTEEGRPKRKLPSPFVTRTSMAQDNKYLPF